MRRRETHRLGDGAKTRSDSATPGREHGEHYVSPEDGRIDGQRWGARLFLALAALALAVIVASGSLALSSSVFAVHQRNSHLRAVSSGTADATATATSPAPPTPTATAAPASRLVKVSCVQGNPPAGVISGTNVPNEVALTFDDGPTPDSTPAVLDELERTHTPATFFVVGEHVAQWPDLLRREAGDGFAIGIHTWDHPDMTTLTPDQQLWQLSATQQAVSSALGSSACVWFWRPPYGAYNQQVLQTAAALHLTTITWDDDPADWSRPGTSVIVQRVLSEVHAGSIVLMHDGPALRQETVAALPAILAGLKARGLRPVTLPQLLADGGLLHAALSSPSGATPSPPSATRPDGAPILPPVGTPDAITPSWCG